MKKRIWKDLPDTAKEVFLEEIKQAYGNQIAYIWKELINQIDKELLNRYKIIK